MDVIKTENEVDPLAVGLQSSEDTDMKERNPSDGVGNLLTPHHVSWTTVEGRDPNYALSCKVKIEETQDQITLPVEKCEFKEDTFELITVKEENTLEVKMEDYEVLADSIGDVHQNRVSLHCDDIANEHLTVREGRENSVFSDKLASVKSIEQPNFHKQSTMKYNLKTQLHSNNPECSIPTKTVDSSNKSNISSNDIANSVSQDKNEKRFKCDVCGKCFKRSLHVKNHIRLHTGDKPFKCDVCGKCFTEMGTLKCHSRLHSGEKPFKCDVCGNSFRRLGLLKNHVRLHTGEKPFKCDVCEQSFPRSGDLKIHVRHHSAEKPFKCDVCDRCFARPDTLKKHIRTHAKVKPFKCNNCGRCYSHSSTLSHHMRIHRQERALFLR